jgi:predicted RNA-binding protein YlxR (DUF448 family)
MRAPQADLVRVVARKGSVGTPGAHAELDPERVHPGRGAYLHPTLTCLDLAERRRALPRALRAEGGLALTGLRAQLEQYLMTSPRRGDRPKAGRDGDEHAMSAQQ